MADLIDRQAAIDGILHLMPPNPNLDDGSAEQLNFSAWKCALTCAEASIKMMPSAQPDEQCDNCHYKHIWMTQRMNGNGFFGHGGATG